MHELKEQMSKMQQDYKSHDDLVKEVFEKAKQHIDRYMKRETEEDERRRVLYDMLDREYPGWEYDKLLGIVLKPLTPEDRKKLEELLNWPANPNPNAEYIPEHDD